jgi:hypothetical protein
MADSSSPAIRQRLVCSLALLELSKSSANSDKYLVSFVHSLVNRYPEESRQCSCFGTCFFFFCISCSWSNCGFGFERLLFRMRGAIDPKVTQFLPSALQYRDDGTIQLRDRILGSSCL